MSGVRVLRESRLPPVRRRTVPQEPGPRPGSRGWTSRFSSHGAQSAVLAAARDPRNLRHPSPGLGRHLPSVLPEAPGRVPTPGLDSQPVSFLISSSSSSRSNVEARDPIAEAEAPPRAGASEATAEAGGKEGREGGPGVKKEEGSVSTAAWGGYPGVARGRGRPRGRPMRSGAAPGAGHDVGAAGSGPRMNHLSTRRVSLDTDTPPEL